MRSKRSWVLTFLTLVFLFGWSNLFNPTEIIWSPKKALAAETELIAAAEPVKAKEGHGVSDHDKTHNHKDGHDSHGDDHGGGHHGVEGKTLALFWGIPFAGVLLSIALFPLLMEHFWHHNYGKIAAFWAVIFVVPFYLHFGHDAIYEFLHIILLDYVPFIILLGTLFTVAGGICLKGSLRGSPGVNTAIIALGTALASFMGTTGAAMLLIRPLIRANSWRKKKVHMVVFFIFLVANIGGALTPLGDPPLFLGFLKGVSFEWTFNLLPQWFLCSVILLIVFYFVDSAFYKKEGPVPDDGEKEPLRLEGKVNFIFLVGIIGAILLSSSLSKSDSFYNHEIAATFKDKVDIAVAAQEKATVDLKAFVETNKENIDGVQDELKVLRENHQDATAAANKIRGQREHDSIIGVKISGVIVPFTNLLRDGLLLFIMFLSLVFTPKQTREDNFFTWEPILEVAKLFSAIFLTIIPVLKILQAGIHGELAPVIWAVLGVDNSPNDTMYFWLTGILSSFLDNAPTYVVFFNTAGGDAQSLMSSFAAGENSTLLAISAGAVFMGANTYIGNAPNFMVKSIAEENKIKMPSFFGYMIWSFGILMPLFAILTFIWYL